MRNIAQICMMLLAVSMFSFTACSSRRNLTKTENQTNEFIHIESEPEKPMELIKPKNTEDPIILAEMDAADAGKKVLEIGRGMALDEKTIVKGSCWDYINEVYRRAGYQTEKTVVFKSPKSGPYADVSIIKPGDWIYYVNYSYNMVEHSGIFVYWEDFDNKIGVTLSYGGEHRNEPGRYRSYDLKSVYYITRPGK